MHHKVDFNPNLNPIKLATTAPKDPKSFNQDAQILLLAIQVASGAAANKETGSSPAHSFDQSMAIFLCQFSISLLNLVFASLFFCSLKLGNNVNVK